MYGLEDGQMEKKQAEGRKAEALRKMLEDIENILIFKYSIKDDISNNWK